MWTIIFGIIIFIWAGLTFGAYNVLMFICISGAIVLTIGLVIGIVNIVKHHGEENNDDNNVENSTDESMSQEDKDMVNYWLITTQNEWDEERKHGN